jgi:hypothetical protein
MMNTSFIPSILGASLYGDDPLTAVPYVLLVCHVLQLMTLAPLVYWITELRCRAHGYRCQKSRYRLPFVCPMQLAAAAARGGRRGVETLLAHAEASSDLERGLSAGGGVAASAAVRATLDSQFLVANLALLVTALTLLLLLLPIPHAGPVAAGIYAARGAIDAAGLCYSRPIMVPQSLPRAASVSSLSVVEEAPGARGGWAGWLLRLLCCSSPGVGDGAAGGVSVAFRRSPPLTLLMAMACSVRLVSVWGQPSLGQYLYTPAPTVGAMRANVGSGVACLLLLVASRLTSGLANPPPARAIRATRSDSAARSDTGAGVVSFASGLAASSYLAFLAVSYLGSCVSFVVLFPTGLASPDLLLVVEWLALFFYSCVFAPALLQHFAAQRAAASVELVRMTLSVRGQLGAGVMGTTAPLLAAAAPPPLIAAAARAAGRPATPPPRGGVRGSGSESGAVGSMFETPYGSMFGSVADMPTQPDNTHVSGTAVKEGMGGMGTGRWVGRSG